MQILREGWTPSRLYLHRTEQCIILLRAVRFRCTMPETTFTFRLDAQLKQSFNAAARKQDRHGSQVLRDFMRSFVTGRPDPATHESWFRDQVQEALDDPRAPVPSAAVERHFARKRSEAAGSVATRNKTRRRAR